jgi:hypothetical protein
MAIDEIQFGEMKGMLTALQAQVSRISDAIIPALARANEKLDKVANDLADHKEKDAVVHACVADLADCIRGDGTPENIGLRKEVSILTKGRLTLIATVSGVGIGMVLLSHGDKLSNILQFLK